MHTYLEGFVFKFINVKVSKGLFLYMNVLCAVAYHNNLAYFATL